MLQPPAFLPTWFDAGRQVITTERRSPPLTLRPASVIFPTKYGREGSRGLHSPLTSSAFSSCFPSNHNSSPLARSHPVFIHIAARIRISYYKNAARIGSTPSRRCIHVETSDHCSSFSLRIGHQSKTYLHQKAHHSKSRAECRPD